MKAAGFNNNDLVSSQRELLDAALLRWGALHLGADRRKDMLHLKLSRFMRWRGNADRS